MNESTPAFRDRIVAAMRHRGPLSVKEICALMPGVRSYSHVYSQLRALEQAGRVVWHSWATLERPRTDGLPIPPPKGTYFEVSADPLPALDDAEGVERWLAD